MICNVVRKHNQIAHCALPSGIFFSNLMFAKAIKAAEIHGHSDIVYCLTVWRNCLCSGSGMKMKDERWEMRDERWLIVSHYLLSFKSSHPSLLPFFSFFCACSTHSSPLSSFCLFCVCSASNLHSFLSYSFSTLHELLFFIMPLFMFYLTADCFIRVWSKEESGEHKLLVGHSADVYDLCVWYKLFFVLLNIS